MSHPHALLINPWVYDFAAFNLWFRPLGLLYLGGWLERRGFSVSLIDCLETNRRDRRYGTGNYAKEVVPRPEVLADVPRRFGRYGISPDDFVARVRAAERPDIICVTSQMTYWYPGVAKVVRIVKEQWPDVPVLVGGIYATLCREHATSLLGREAMVLHGPFESVISGQLSDFSFIKSNINNDIDLIKEGVSPAWHLYPNLRYISILTTRGCPFNCHYCASDRLYHGFGYGDIDQTVALIRQWEHAARVRDFAFFDDALLCNPERHFIPLAQKIIDNGLRCRFHLPNGISPRFITPKIADLMYRAGFTTLRLSFESVREERQADSSKKVTGDDLARAVDCLKKAGFRDRQLEAYVLMGVPGQDMTEVVESMLFVRSLGGYPLLASYALIPGTPYFDASLQEMGMTEPPDPLLHNNSTYPLWRKKYSWEAINAVNLMKRYIHALDPVKCRLLDPTEVEGNPEGFLKRLQTL